MHSSLRRPYSFTFLLLCTCSSLILSTASSLAHVPRQLSSIHISAWCKFFSQTGLIQSTKSSVHFSQFLLSGHHPRCVFWLNQLADKGVYLILMRNIEYHGVSPNEKYYFSVPLCAIESSYVLRCILSYIIPGENEQLS